MERIASFSVNHDVLEPGLYLSRIDGDCITYDVRMKKPNGGEYLSNGAMHTFEHLFATYVRNSEIGDRVIYFGPMGCATGFYLLVRNSLHTETLNAVLVVLQQIINHKGEVFGNSEIECGNYKTLCLEAAVSEAKKYLSVLKQKENDFKYPLK